MSWKRVKLSDLCTDIIDCVNKTAPKSLKETPYKMIRTSDIKDGVINLEGLFSVTEETFKKWTRRGDLQVGDVILTREAPIGEVGIVKDPNNIFLGQRLVLYRTDRKKCDPRFLLYSLMYPENKMAIIAKGSGATVPHLRVPECGKIEISIPDLETQHRIADILSAYDDLVENNKKQIKLLEEAAQRLYKEWFVDLHFPGYENTKIIDGIPEGYFLQPISDCLEAYLGGGWGKESPDGKNNYLGTVIRGTDINSIKAGDFKSLPVRYHTDNDRRKKALKADDIVFELSNGNINNIGRSLLIDDFILEQSETFTICASFCKLLRPKNRFLAIIIYWAIQDMQKSGKLLTFKKQGSNGINNFSFEDFLNYRVIVPEGVELVESLDNIMKMISDIRKKIALLIEARERLLDNLMNRKLEA